MIEDPADNAAPWITVLNPDHLTPDRVPILDAPNGSGFACRLLAIPGADAVHVAISSGATGAILCRCEIPASPGSCVSLTLRQGEGGWLIESDLPGLLLLPAGAGEPLPALPPGTPTTEQATDWDVALVIDATARWFEPAESGTLDASGLLLADQQRRVALGRLLTELLCALTPEQGQLRLAVLAFGDHPIPGVDAKALRSAFSLQHRGQQDRIPMRPFQGRDAQDILQGLDATPGGDFVDALADALAGCRTLPWSAARRLLVIVGDSPGHSIAHPAPPGADVLAREHDVDLEVAALHADRQVEVVTLYNRPPAELIERISEPARALLVHAEEQYRRLASLPDYARDLDGLDAVALARQLRERSTMIARGASYGILA
jgi:hypothetical protein